MQRMTQQEEEEVPNLPDTPTSTPTTKNKVYSRI